VNNSLFSRLQQLNPNVELVRCVAHSLNNAASSAANELPANVDFLGREVYNWFCHSSCVFEDRKTLIQFCFTFISKHRKQLYRIIVFPINNSL
jgi:hypothetical protein